MRFADGRQRGATRWDFFAPLSAEPPFCDEGIKARARPSPETTHSRSKFSLAPQPDTAPPIPPRSGSWAHGGAALSLRMMAGRRMLHGARAGQRRWGDGARLSAPARCRDLNLGQYSRPTRCPMPRVLLIDKRPDRNSELAAAVVSRGLRAPRLRPNSALAPTATFAHRFGMAGGGALARLRLPLS